MAAAPTEDTVEFRLFEGAKEKGNLDRKIKKFNLKHHAAVVNTIF